VGIVACEGEALGEAAARDLSAPVPAAPGWDVAELLRHQGMIHARTSVILRTGTMERPSRRNGLLPEAPAEGVLDWYREGLAQLVADLRALGDPDRPVYSFAPGHERAGFWPRRMAHETTVHRVDAQQAVGVPVSPIDAALAVDGIDEILTVFVPALAGGRSPADERVVLLRPVDVEAIWRVSFGADLVVERDPEAAVAVDAVVGASAADLLLWLWGRVPLAACEVVGDRSAAEALRSVTTF